MSRVLILANHNATIYYFRRELIQRLVGEGHEVVVSVPSHERNGVLRALGCTVVETPMSRFGTNPFQELGTLLRYVRIIRRIAPQVVLTYTAKSNAYGGLAAQLCRVPYISTVTGLGAAFQSEGLVQHISSLLQRAAFKRAAKVYFQNSDNLSTFRRLSIVKGPTEMLPGSGVNLSLHRVEPYSAGEGGKRFITVARVRRDKGFDELLEVIRRLCTERDDVEFHVVGRFEHDGYKDIAAEMESSFPIVFHGSVSAERVHELVTASHCLVHPSHHEGMSNAILEASASGRAVIASDIPGCREAVEDGVTGYLYPVRDADALHASVERFLAMGEDAQRAMGEAGRRKMEAEFDREVVVDRYMAAIRSVLAGRAEKVTV